MPKLPDLDSNYVAPQPTTAVASYDPTIVDKAMQDSSNTIEQASDELHNYQNIQSMQDATNRRNDAERQTINFLYGDGTPQNPGLYSMKGGDAVGAGQKFDAFFSDLKQKQLDGVTNPAAQRALTNELQGMWNSNIQNVKSHELTESRAYSGDLTNAATQIAAQRAGLEYNNDNTFNQSLSQADQSTAAKAKIAGVQPGDAIYQSMIQDGRTAVITSRLAGQLSSKDPNERLQAYQDYETKYRPMMSLEGVQKMDSTFETALPQIQAYAGFQKVLQSRGMAPATTPQLADAIQQAESNGRQFDADGNPLTSGKGAVGVMQVEPDTARDAAKLAGVDFDLHKYMNDPAYNRQLGEAYLGSLQNKYGDNTLATIAYNAGPGTLDDWMNGTNKSGKNPNGLNLGDPRTGAVSMDKFVASIPFLETRQYVAKVAQAAGAGTGVINPQQAKDYAATMPVYAQKDFMDMVDTHNTQVAAAQDQNRKSLMDEALNQMGQGTNFAAMPVALRSGLQQAGIAQQVQNYNPTAPSDPSTLTYLYHLDPKTLAATDLNTPGIRLSLSPQDYTRFTQKQSALSNPAMQVTAEARDKMMKQAFQRRGIALREKYDYSNLDSNGQPTVSYDGNQDFIRANDLVDQSIDAYTAQHKGQYPDMPTIQKMVDGVFTDVITQRSQHWWTSNDSVTPYKMTVDQIPQADQQQIRAALSQNGITPTDQVMLSTYLRNKGAKL